MVHVSPNVQLAIHLHQVFHGGNWTAVSFKDVVEQLSFEDAQHRLPQSHSIAELVYHISYYLHAILDVFEGHTLKSKDAESFDLPSDLSSNQWKELKSRILKESKALAKAIEAMRENQLADDFVDPEYGSYYRNIMGLIEHTHYHLGQISLIKKDLIARRK
jgi:uncharacterized damage-inducible protein DinB